MSPILGPILLFALLAAALAVGMLAVGSLVGPRRNTPVKEMPYESGMDPVHDARRRFDVRFHLVAIAFLLFDVELVFLYPWAVSNKAVDGIGAAAPDLPFFPLIIFAELLVFVGMLGLGFVYAWRKGLFRWP
ncbi:MAG: NADH-quinone oxidoreductase subunit A [Planctomycetes bacterium]|nr:NADH-quinone oxidoreductase subunit A [Planctomycetota bacterium]